MRICVVSDQAFPAWGGEGVATQNLCTLLSKRGHELLFFTSKVFRPPVSHGIEFVRFPSIFIPQKGHFGGDFSNRITGIFKRKKIQIIHANLPTFLSWQSFYAAKKLNIPRVAGLHVQIGNVIPWQAPPAFFLKKLLELWFSYFYTMADLSISPSNLGKEILSSYGCRKIEVVSNGIDLNSFTPSTNSFAERQEFREKFGLEDAQLLLYVGRLSREKNVLYLPEIVKVLNTKHNIKLLVIGKGSLEESLRRKIQSMNLEDRIVLCGFLAHEELPNAYQEAEIFITPSLFELQSIVALEAMAMGCVLLVGKSDQSAVRELVKEGVNGYSFDLDDPFDAAEKIDFILSNPGLKESMQKASLAAAREHDTEKIITKLEGIYCQLLENREIGMTRMQEV